MTFRQIEFFVAAGKYGSINKAAESVRLSQQAISKALRELELELGCRLMTRTTTGITMTDYGNYVFHEFEQLIARRDCISKHVLKMKEHKKEPLSIGMSIGVLHSFPYWLIPDFINSNPNIDLRYEDYMDKVLEQKLADNEYDMAIISGPLFNKEFQTKTLRREHVLLCIPAGHPLYQESHIEMKQLQTQNFVLFSGLFNLHHNFLASCSKAGFVPEIMMTLNDYKSLKEIAVSSESLIIVPESMQDNDSRFRHVPFPDSFLTQDMMLVMNQDKYLTRSMKRFIEYITYVLQDTGAPLQQKLVAGGL